MLSRLTVDYLDIRRAVLRNAVEYRRLLELVASELAFIYLKEAKRRGD